MFGWFLALAVFPGERPAHATGTTALPAPWTGRDIGAVMALGSAAYSDNTFTLKGSGIDIWGRGDEFHFVHQTLSGDGHISCQVDSISHTDDWAKAGVMIRESLEPDSKFAMVVATPRNGLAFKYRATTGADAIYVHLGAAGAPAWVKLARAGNRFVPYTSSDGAEWKKAHDGADFAMGTVPFMGLAVTSHNDGILSTATFRNVSAWPPMVPPAITSQPATSEVFAGQSGLFRVGVSDTSGLTFQWRKNGTDIPGANRPYYRTEPSKLADDGAGYQCVVRNSAGFSLSASAKLRVAGSAIGKIQREYWNGIGGTSIGDLLKSSDYPGAPTGQDNLDRFEAPVDWNDNYGTRIRGYVIPPQNGNYTFYISGDDESRLFLSPDADPEKIT